MWPDCPTVNAVRIRNIRRESARICSLQSVVLGLNGLNLTLSKLLSVFPKSENSAEKGNLELFCVIVPPKNVNSVK